MTWGAVIDTRRTITSFFFVMFIAVLGTFVCILLLVGSDLLVENPSSPIYQISTDMPLR